MKSPKFAMVQMQEIHASARAAGLVAAEKAGKEMATYVIKDGFSGQVQGFMRGSCGFAWVIVKPGNSPFANFLKKERLARPDSYYGGVNIWVSEFNQSMEMKEAYAHAYADVLRKKGINAYAGSRMD